MEYLIILVLAYIVYNFYTTQKIKKIQREIQYKEMEMRIKMLEDKIEELEKLKDKN